MSLHEIQLEDVLAECGVRLMVLDNEGRVFWLTESLRSDLAAAESTTSPPPVTLSAARPDHPLLAPDDLRTVAPGEVATVPWGDLLYRVRVTKLRGKGTALTWQSVPPDGFLAQALAAAAQLDAGAYDVRFDTANAPPGAARLLSALNRHLDTVTDGLDNLMSDLDQLANGRLDIGWQDAARGPLQAVHSRLKAAVGSTHSVLLDIASSVHAIAGQSSHLSEQNTNLNRYIDEQDDALDDTASAVEELTTAVRQTVSEGRAQANGVARKFELLIEEVRISSTHLTEISTATQKQNTCPPSRPIFSPATTASCTRPPSTAMAIFRPTACGAPTRRAPTNRSVAITNAPVRRFGSHHRRRTALGRIPSRIPVVSCYDYAPCQNIVPSMTTSDGSPPRSDR